MEKNEIKFLRLKEYKFISELNRGGFGRTILIEDELIGERFVCKKYSPFNPKDQEAFYKNFVQEIKLLHLVNYRNIVRVFNYYLYPERHTGYILMEYIKGLDIEQYIKINPDRINDVFVQTVKGFRHLEELRILHRDIRPQNILLTEDGIVKIIDFGFGKQIDFQSEDFDKSISLNWRYTPPSEFKIGVYDFRTELYFVGKLFQEIIEENVIELFSYNNIIRKMTLSDFEKRVSSFFEVERELLSEESLKVEFSRSDRATYLTFADQLKKVFRTLNPNCEYRSDISLLIQSMENVYSVSMLEYVLQNNSLITDCFVKGSYTYLTKLEFTISNIQDFLGFFKKQPIEKQKIVLNNIWQRLDTIKRIDSSIGDDLPF